MGAKASKGPQDAQLVPDAEVPATVQLNAFYGEFHGHLIPHLQAVMKYAVPRAGRRRPVIWLAGDSSLDNKYWIGAAPARAANGMADVLQPAKSVRDVCHHVNSEIVRRGLHEHWVCVNTSVEESLLAERKHALLPQDQFIHDNIQPEDVLVVSVGGNDIALSPSVATGFNMLRLMNLSSMEAIENGTAWGLDYFRALFGTKVKEYVEKIIGDTKPRRVMVCMIYFPDENKSECWASRALGALKYETEPAKLQAVIRSVFESATSQIKIPGVDVVPVPLFEVLDPTNSKDYCSRVEPSNVGGAKMAARFVDELPS